MEPSKYRHYLIDIPENLPRKVSWSISVCPLRLFFRSETLDFKTKGEFMNVLIFFTSKSIPRGNAKPKKSGNREPALRIPGSACWTMTPICFITMSLKTRTTSCHGDDFRNTGPLQRESTDHPCKYRALSYYCDMTLSQ